MKVLHFIASIIMVSSVFVEANISGEVDGAE